MTLFKNGFLLLNEEFVKKDFLVENGKFIEIADNITCDIDTIDLKNKKVIAGLIDIHTHGGFGVDFNHASPQDIVKVCDYYHSQGVTSVLPTILTDTIETTKKSIENVVFAKETLNVSTIIGIHLEGPFLAKEYKGAMPEELLRTPDIDLFNQYQKVAKGLVKLTTVSPELPGACEFASDVTKSGVVCSCGHSGASQEQVLEFFDAGATNVTHLGNAMKQPTQHNLNVCGTALYADVFTEIICDGFHINPTVADFWFRVKGPEKMIAVTDCIMAAGLSDGDYMLGVNEVTVTNGDAKLKGKDTRAGSTLKAINAISNIAKFTKVPFEKAVRYMTENPAKSLGIFDEKGSIDVSKCADFVVLNDDFTVLQTFIAGQNVYTA